MTDLAPSLQRTGLPQALLYAVFGIAALLKLYLVAGQDIIAMPWDSYQYLWMADAWYWGNIYAFARRPGYPLFLAVVSNTGIPLRLVFELLYLGASARLATALVRMGFPRWSAALGFLFTIFLPYTFVQFDYGMVECMLTPMLIWGTAEFAYLFTTRGARFWAHNFLLALIVTLIWYSRSESILIEGAGAATAVILIGGPALRRQALRPATVLCLRLLGPSVAAVALGGVLVASLNLIYFHRFLSTEVLRDPAFVRAYDDLQDIRAPHTEHYVPFSSAQMQKAAAVSPAFAEIYPAFQGKIGDNYRRIAANEAGVHGQIAGGWLIWAIREAVDGAGYHTIPAQDAFYRRMALEIEAAARAGKISLIHFPVTLLDPHWRVWLPYLPHSLAMTANMLLPEQRLTTPVQAIVPAKIAEEFNLRANRRAALVVPNAPDPRAARADRALALLSDFYRPVLIALGALGLILLAAIGWRRLSLPVMALFAAILVPIAGRVALIALLDASSYPTGGIDRYVMPAAGLLPFLICSLLSLGCRQPE